MVFISLLYSANYLQGDFAKICYLCVDENMRSKGVGHLLVKEAEQQADAEGCDRMELHSGMQDLWHIDFT